MNGMLNIISKIYGWVWGLVHVATRPAMLCVLSLVAAGAIYQVENNWLPVPFAICIVALLASILFAISLRPAFSYYCALFIFGTITAASLMKFKLKGFSLHYYDFVFVISDPTVIQFLAGSFGYLIVPMALLILIVSIAALILFQTDPKQRVGKASMVACVAVPALMLPVTFPTEAMSDRYSYYLQGRNATAFFVSLLDLENLFLAEKLERKLAATPPEIPFQDAPLCPSDPPDVFIVLGESESDPSIFPQIGKGRELGQRLAKANGPLQPLVVEKFGGGTWISNLSLLTGLPSRAFGWRSPYLTIELEGKVGGSLPDLFSRCGYRTVALLPMEFTFVNEGPFLKSIGFESIFDLKAIDAPHYHMRDRFYFEAARRIIAEHRRTDGRPLFFTMQTMFAHSPYNERLAPETHVDGEPLHNDPDVAEYLRRLVIARQDLAEFVDEQRAGKSERGLVLLDFGDHQSFATKGFVEEIDGMDAMSRPGSIAYRTFYTMRHFEKQGVSTYQDDKPVDIALLGTRLLNFASLPSSAMWDELARIDKQCNGSLEACAKTGQLERHLRRRVDSGLLNIFMKAPGSGPNKRIPYEAGL